MLGKLKTAAGKIVFRLAFMGLILVQFVAVILLLWGLSEVISGDNYFEAGILAALLLLSPFLIGANSYFLFQRFTRVQYVLAESGRWLAERRKFGVHQIRTRNRIRHWVLWIPALSVLLCCLFLDETWPPASHLFYPAAGRLVGYNVSLPLTWAIGFREPCSNSHSCLSGVLAFRSRRVFRDSLEFLFGGRPLVSVSWITFKANPPRDKVSSPWRPEGQLPMGRRSFPIGDTLIGCEEFAAKPDQEKEQLDIRCTTARDDLSCTFVGDRNDAATFYGVVERIQKTR